MMRTLTIAVLTLLTTVVAVAPALAQTDAEAHFRRLAETDVFPEVRRAAANVLVTVWTEIDINLDALAEIADNGLTAELRGAAQQAIAARTVTKTLSINELKALVVDGAYEAVRERAAEQLSQTLLDAALDLEALIALVGGNNQAIRHAAVAALANAWFESDLSAPDLVTLAIDGENAELRQAAADAAVRRLNDELSSQSTESLLELAQGGMLDLTQIVGQNSAALKQAAAEALRDNFQDEATSISQVEAVAADPANSLQLRQVAGEVLGRRLLRERRTLDELLTLAGQGATPEAQASAIDALEQVLVTEVGLGNLELQALIDQINPEDSHALNTARANAAFTLLRPNLIFVTDQPLLEAVLRRETASIGGAEIDGANDFLRRAATDFLAGLFLQFGAINRFEEPLGELLEMASNTSLELEFRIAAGRGLEKFLRAQRGKALDAIGEIEGTLDRIVITGRRGQTEEAFELLDEVRGLLENNQPLIAVTAEAAGDLGVPLRFTTIRDQLAEFPEAIRSADSRALRDINGIIAGQLTQISVSLAGAPDTTDSDLIELASTGVTPEVRAAASAVLAGRLSGQAANGNVMLEALVALARGGLTFEVQTATVDALALAYARSDLSDDELLTLALEGETDAVQRAAASAWIQRQDVETERFTDLANGAGVLLGEAPVAFTSDELSNALTELIQASLASDNVPTPTLIVQAQDSSIPALQRAASRLLPDRFLDDALTRDALIELSVESESEAVRAAASQALGKLLIAQRLPEFVLFGLISQFTLAVDNALSSPELADALVAALTDRFLHPLDPAPAPGKPPTIGADNT